MRLEPFALERFFAEHEFSAPYNLCASDCESMTVADLLAFEPDAEERLRSLRLNYTESLGDPALRAAIATQYERAGADDVLVYAGAEEAIFGFMNVALAPGDHVVVHSPCYQSLAEVARAIGCEVCEWRGDPARAWALDLGELEALLTARTTLVVVNMPHNPTGFGGSETFVRGLASLADARGFSVFSDEVYRGLEVDEAHRLPAFADLSERGVSLGVLSKTYGLAGLRIGWIATRDAALLERLAAFKDYTTICSSAPSEFLATLALRHAEPIAARNRAIVRTNLDALDAFFAAHAERFEWSRPKAGSVAFPMLRGGGVESWCAELVRRAGVLLLPGTVYGAAYGDRFRIGFGRADLPQGLDRLDAYLGGALA